MRQPLASFCVCGEQGSSAGPSSEVSSSSPESQDIYTKLPVIVSSTNTHTHTHTCTHTTSLSIYYTDSAERSSGESLSQSVPRRCVSIDKGCVKYCNKQNGKVVFGMSAASHTSTLSGDY